MSKKEMQLAINVASVADGTVAGALTYCKDLGVAKVVVPFGSVPGFNEKGYTDPADIKAVKDQVQEAGLDLTTMQIWPPLTPSVMGPEGEAEWAKWGCSLDSMGANGIDTLNVFVVDTKPQDPAKLEKLGLFHHLLPQIPGSCRQERRERGPAPDPREPGAARP
jgi:sugar phosphate isomerase/epimerase